MRDGSMWAAPGGSPGNSCLPMGTLSGPKTGSRFSTKSPVAPLEIVLSGGKWLTGRVSLKP